MAFLLKELVFLAILATALTYPWRPMVNGELRHPKTVRCFTISTCLSYSFLLRPLFVSQLFFLSPVFAGIAFSNLKWLVSFASLPVEIACVRVTKMLQINYEKKSLRKITKLFVFVTVKQPS